MNLEPPIGEFNYSRLERVLFGPGKVAALRNELERRGLSRALVVTGQTLGRSPLLETVTGALGPLLAGVFTGAKQHVPASTTSQLVEQIEALAADCLVSFGGGSPIDTAKVAAHALLKSGRELALIAIPTTLSAGEYTAGGGVTDEASQVKSAVHDPRLLARTVINDPQLTLETPDWLWAASGMRALDHAIEAIYAARHQPISDTLASKAIRLLRTHLAASLKSSGDEQLAHRGFCQIASWFSIFGAGNVRFGISHALGHQIGPRWNVPHGVTSCITLPHVMRFMAEHAPERFGPIAEGFEIPFDPANPQPSALECAERTKQFIASFDLPNSLQKAGVPREEIEQIVSPVAHEIERGKSFDRPLTREEIISLLQTAYD